MDKIKTQRLRLILLLSIGCLLASGIFFSLYINYKTIQLLRSLEIYELSFTYVQVEKRTEVHYMICESSDDKKEIEEKVNAFLAEQNIIEMLKIRSAEKIEELSITNGEYQPLVGMNLVFLSPSKDLDIGEFPDDIYDSRYNIGKHRLLTVSIYFINDDKYEIEYLWARNLQ